METRPYFIVGDVLVNVAAGVVAALAARVLVGPSWNVLLAMPAGSIVGMLTSLPVALLFMPFFGAFEVMLPAMLTGMIAGMLAAMRPAEAALLGILSGLASVSYVYALTAWVRSKDRAGHSHRA